MVQFAREVLPINIEDEMRQSYLDYAMSVIVGRALPDVRDGLKPVHRRTLFAMNELGNHYNKSYKKSARVVGDVLGKYHPHGESAVYDTIVRMAQPFSLRYMLVDGQGNFGSIDGDNAAAMRYTEIRMAKIAHEMLIDLDKDTVDFVPNYDGAEREPVVFPARIPNLLINGTSGIAVGMATNIPPHNLREVINACIALIDDPTLSIAQLMEYVIGPDFPTAAQINGAEGIVEAYNTGRGRIYVRAKADIEEEDDGGRQRIIIHELPYQVNKARLIERIAELVKERKIEGISELRDESDKDGVRIVIELRRGEMADVLLNHLYQYTQLQTVFGINMVALVDSQPRLLNLKQMLELFLRHRREVVTRRTLFELRKARDRAHVLEGLAIALSNLDEMIVLIRGAASPQAAREAMLARFWLPGVVTAMLERSGAYHSRPQGLADDMGLQEDGYHLSVEQAQAILDLRLHRLTGLEQDKIIAEYQTLLDRIAELLDILSSGERLMTIIREELETVCAAYGDDRRTEIQSSREHLDDIDFITEENVTVTLSHGGYIKAQPMSSYQAQKRGGRGRSATQMKDDDFIDKLFVANTHDTLLCFTTFGRVYWLKVYQVPQASRNARGRPIVNLLPLEENERITAVMAVREYSEDNYIFMATARGTVKKTPLVDFSRPRSKGIIAIGLDEDDYLVGASLTNGQSDVMLFSRQAKAVRFNESNVRQMGRTAHGVRGIALGDEDQVISLIIPRPGSTILTATVNGYGKRTALDEYPSKGRGNKGVITIKTSERNGDVVAVIQVQADEHVMLISNRGTLVRTPVEGISLLGRNTQGVTLINLSDQEQLVAVERVEDEDIPDEVSGEDDEIMAVDTEV